MQRIIHEQTGWRIYFHDESEFKKGNFFISCTTILDCVVHQSLKEYFKKNSAAKQAKVLKAAGDAGSNLHKLIELYENKEMHVPIDDYEREQFRRWDEIKEQNEIEILKTEYPVWNDLLWVAGTADYILTFKKDGKKVLGIGDLKTGRYDIKAGWQMAFYLDAYRRIKDKSASAMIGISLPRDLEKKHNAFVYQHVDSCLKAYISAWNCFRMLYWNTLEKMGWKGLGTQIECYPIDVDDMQRKFEIA